MGSVLALDYLSLFGSIRVHLLQHFNVGLVFEHV